MQNRIQLAVEAIHNKECVVFPTETVYGLGANALCEQSVNKIFRLKNRPPSNPLIVHVANIDQVLSVAETLTDLEIKLFEFFAPGPLSLILPKKQNVPSVVTGNLDSVGVRIPNHLLALEFLSQVRLPICAPSANISGCPSPTTFEMAEFYMKDKAFILDGGVLDLGIESTVVKVEGSNIYILRPGCVTSEMIADKTGIKPISKPDQEHLSPGTRFPHYKPKAQISIFEGVSVNVNDKKSAILYLNPDIDVSGFDKKILFCSIEEYIRSLYYTFFECDQLRIEVIYCELPSNIGQGIALRDRLLKAAL